MDLFLSNMMILEGKDTMQKLGCRDELMDNLRKGTKEANKDRSR